MSLDKMSPKTLSELDPTQKARLILWDHICAAGGALNFSDVRVTWFNYTLGGWKSMLCLAGTKDNSYFEVTYNKVTDEYYLDEYQLVHHSEFTPKEFGFSEQA